MMDYQKGTYTINEEQENEDYRYTSDQEDVTESDEDDSIEDFEGALDPS